MKYNQSTRMKKKIKKKKNCGSLGKDNKNKINFQNKSGLKFLLELSVNNKMPFIKD